LNSSGKSRLTDAERMDQLLSRARSVMQQTYQLSEAPVLICGICGPGPTVEM
jgi:hypothetical protein